MTRQQSFLCAAISAVLAASAVSAQAATCQGELDRFERRLHSSNLATQDPDTFEELIRRSGEAAEYRDEERCLQVVAELNAELPEADSGDAGAQPTSSLTSEGAKAPAPSRPAAPVLLIAGGQDDAPAADSAADEDDN